ncbi:MAG: DoxX family membrane protein, partial [Alphaproteobacteria bacterium]|nr:DoxX family membrane protein [Alphaproteobacteria bacterium]
AFFLITFARNTTPAGYKDHLERMQGFGVPFTHAVLCVGFLIQIVGSLLVLVNWRTDIGALLLIVFTVAATLIFHRFWIMEDPMRRNVARLFVLNNTCIVGGLVLLLARA